MLSQEQITELDLWIGLVDLASKANSFHDGRVLDCSEYGEHTRVGRDIYVTIDPQTLRVKFDDKVLDWRDAERKLSRIISLYVTEVADLWHQENPEPIASS